MQSYSHFVLTALLNRSLQRRRAAETFYPAPNPTGLLLGSVAPDVPLTVTAAAFILLDIANVRLFGDDVRSNTSHLFQTMFFENRVIKVLHNLFHAPFLTLLYTLVGYLGWLREKRWGPVLFWFGVSTMLHTAIDIPLHHDDGPLLLFPFEWETRFASPVSYWDAKHFGRQFTLIEHILVVAGLVSLWRHRRFTALSPQ